MKTHKLDSPNRCSAFCLPPTVWSRYVLISAIKHYTEAGQDEHRKEASLLLVWWS